MAQIPALVHTLRRRQRRQLSAVRAIPPPCATSRPADIPAPHGFVPWVPPRPVSVSRWSAAFPLPLRHCSATSPRRSAGMASRRCVGARGQRRSVDRVHGTPPRTCTDAAADYPSRVHRSRLPEQCVAHHEVAPDEYRADELSGRSGPGHPAGWGSPQYADDRGSTQRGDLLRQSLTPREQVQPPGIPAAADVSCRGRSGHPEHEPAPSAVRGHCRSPRKPASALIVNQMRRPACDGHRGRTRGHKSQKGLPAALTRVSTEGLRRSKICGKHPRLSVVLSRRSAAHERAARGPISCTEPHAREASCAPVARCRRPRTPRRERLDHRAPAPD